jgi:hypothetical protein
MSASVLSSKYIKVRGCWYDDTSENIDIKEFTVELCRSGGMDGYLIQADGTRHPERMVDIKEILGPSDVLSPAERLAASYPTAEDLKNAVLMSESGADYTLACSALISALAYTLGGSTELLTHYSSPRATFIATDDRLEICVSLRFSIRSDAYVRLFGKDGEDPIFTETENLPTLVFIEKLGTMFKAALKDQITKKLKAAELLVELAQDLNIA